MQFLKSIAVATVSMSLASLFCNHAHAELLNLRVTSENMMPTLGPGDVIAATSYAPDESIKRGDLVAYKAHYMAKSFFKGGEDTRVNAIFLGRIVGLPGEKIEIVNGVPLIDGKPLTHTKVESALEGGCPEHLAPERCQLVREVHSDGRNYLILDEITDSLGDNVAAKTLADNEYYIMGDSRDNSNDSRFDQVGLVKHDNIRGKVRMIWGSVRTPDRQWRLDGFPGLK